MDLGIPQHLKSLVLWYPSKYALSQDPCAAVHFLQGLHGIHQQIGYGNTSNVFPAPVVDADLALSGPLLFVL